MKFANTVQHLSNKEVLTHFASLKQDNDHLKTLIKQRADRNELALQRKYPLPGEELDDEVDDDVNDDYRIEHKAEVVSPAVEKEEKEAERRGYSEELGWITDEVISYLCSDLCPTSRQTDDSITVLATTLQNWGLVKGEVLQLINLAPSSAPEIYCVIEELETRMAGFENPLEDIIRNIQSTLVDVLPEFEQFVKREGEDHDGWDEGAEHEQAYVQEDDYGAGDEEEQFITEAEWGKDKEEGVGEEQENPFE